MRQGVLCTPSVAYTGIVIACKRKFSHLEEKNIVQSMMKSPNSMLSTSFRMVDTRMMKKNSWKLQEDNMSILFLNQLGKTPHHVLRIVVLVFVELDLEDEFLC